MFLANHAFARVTPAIFVIFVVFTGFEQQTFCFTGWMQIRHFCRFVKTSLYLVWFTTGMVYQRHGLCDPNKDICTRYRHRNFINYRFGGCGLHFRV